MTKPESSPKLPPGKGPFDRLNHWEAWGIVAMVIAAIGLGVATEIHSAFLIRRQTDVDTYFRAAWAIRAGVNPYHVVDTNGWHYNYPPLLAILLYPFGDAPPGRFPTDFIPYAVSVGLWYVISLIFTWISVDWLARALEHTSTDLAVRNQPKYCRRWWALRIVPLLVVLPALGRALARGQVNPLLMVCLSGAGAMLAYRRELWGGVCAGFAAALKLFPIFLVVYAVRRGGLKWLIGMAMAMVIGMGLIPLAVMGPSRTMTAYRTLNRVIVEPALGLNHNASRDRELFDVNDTDSNSFEAVIDHTIHFGHLTPAPDEAVKITHWSLSAVLVALTIFVGWRMKTDDAIARNVFLGTLIAIMLPIIPICHPHYFCMVLPLPMALLASQWEHDHKLPIGWGLGWVLILFAVSHILTVLPRPFAYLRDLGLVMYADVILWAAGMLWMWRFRSSEPSGQQSVG
ncbi:MAG: DUF2029 domain-containing protein [Phycisphaerae bacterium]|nr:DUF2029 domain-containing protein [Phycisphaerae bacterium]